ncbi:hypothetical protein PUN28_002183 [Cardiocondyla obscurior]|uniref:Uncharacterized protein n=1 Tax=Cardiocondyla obscurior TaxID=286306 RepID=A0AAW2GT04_9HYME
MSDEDTYTSQILSRLAWLYNSEMTEPLRPIFTRSSQSAETTRETYHNRMKRAYGNGGISDEEQLEFSNGVSLSDRLRDEATNFHRDKNFFLRSHPSPFNSFESDFFANPKNHFIYTLTNSKENTDAPPPIADASPTGPADPSVYRDDTISEPRPSNRDHSSPSTRAQGLAPRDEAIETLLDAKQLMATRLDRIESEGLADKFGIRSNRFCDLHARETKNHRIEDVRFSLNHPRHFLTLQYAINFIPQYDGYENNVKTFVKAYEYVAKKIDPEEEDKLLAAILYTKLSGRALLRFEFKRITDFE